MKKKIPVAELRYGMYVWELDRPWTDTPFLFQGWVLETPEQLETLREFCSFVYVDSERSVAPDHKGAEASATPLPGVGQVKYTERVAVEAELPQAATAYEGTQLALEAAFKAVSLGENLDAGQLKNAVAKTTESIIRNQDALVLFSKLKERSSYLVGRAANVSIYMITFARFLGLGPEEIEKAGMVGLLQDVGNLRLSDELLAKRERLTPEEFETIKGHVKHSVEILGTSPELPPWLPKLAALHHERFDGSGYPNGVSGAEIGTIGGIAGICDVFDAMTSKRPYAAPLPPSTTLGMLHKMRGKSFHPELVEQFIRCVGIFPVGSVVELNSGEVGIVIAQNIEKRLQPRVMVVRTPEGQALRPQKLLDLSKSPRSSPDETYRIRRTLEFGQTGVGVKDLFL
jgi:HD-GYP domain-containing protein (c-di-GMP phosphodiesterase class II)